MEVKIVTSVRLLEQFWNKTVQKAVEIYEGDLTVMRKHEYYEITLQICLEMAIIHNDKLLLKDTLVLI